MTHTSLLSRKRDLVYFMFFTIHIPIMLNVDFTTLYPEWIRPQWSFDLIEWYVLTYKDKFFITSPLWFKAFTWIEVFYHVPLCIWAIGAISRDDPRVPLHLLVYAVETAVTTITCIAEFLTWEEIGLSAKIQLCYLYVPYLLLSVFMGLDMFFRLNTTLKATGRVKKE